MSDIQLWRKTVNRQRTILGLARQIAQTNSLLKDVGVASTTAIVDLGFRGVDQEVAPVKVIHRGKYKTLTALQRRWLKRRQAIEPMIGHTKSDN